MILTLGGLLLLVFLTLWLLRKLTQGRIGSFGTQKKIKILEKRPLSHKTMLYLLELDGKQVFISESQLEVKSLLNLSEVELD
jgi:flagellar protein FliO/FliZ